MKNDQIEIPLSKTKLWLLNIGSILFVLISIWMLIANVGFHRYNPIVVKLAAIAGILFFGATSFFGFKKLFDKKFGLIINEEGILDNTSGISVGLIKWDDIVDIQINQVMTNKFISIYVKNQDEYIAKAKNKMMARIMKSNIRMVGTPISISSNTLSYNFNNLKELIFSSFDKYKS